MHSKITMEISICQAENGFSLDELVKKVADGAVAKPHKRLQIPCFFVQIFVCCRKNQQS